MNKIILKDNLYNVIDLTTENENAVDAKIKLIGECAIFKGHFPGFPILPGVCSIQIVRELLSLNYLYDLYISRLSSIKFLSVINLTSDNVTEIKITVSNFSSNGLSVDARYLNDDKPVIKIQGLELVKNLNVN